MLDGAQYVEALSRLGYPQASKLKGSEFDWLFDTAPDNLHLLRVVCNRLNPSNILTEEELQAYKTLQQSGKPILDETTLADLLKTFSPVYGSVGSQLHSPMGAEGMVTTEQLEAELQALQKEKQLKLQRLNMLQMQAIRFGSNSSSSQSQLLQGINLVKDANSALAAENANNNSALENLSKETTKLSAFFQTTTSSINNKEEATPPSLFQSGSPVLFSQLSLEPLLQQQEQFTNSLVAYTQHQFFQGTSDMMETSALSHSEFINMNGCTEKGEVDKVELMKKEMAQLKWSFTVAQYQLIKEKAEEHGLKVAKVWLMQHLNRDAHCYSQIRRFEPDLRSEILSVQSEIQSLLSGPVRSILRDCACLLNIPVVRGDLAFQVARLNDYTSKQSEVRDQLLCQKAVFDLVRLAQDSELLMGKRMMKQLSELVKRLEGAAEAAAQRETTMMQPNLTSVPGIGSNAKHQVISSKDVSFSRLLQLLELGKTITEKEDLFQTFTRIETAASNLHKDLVTLQEALDGARQEQAFTGARLERDRDVLDQAAYADIVQPLLRPQVCGTVTPALELCPHAQELTVVMEELEVKQKTSYARLQEIDRDLKAKRGRLERSAILRRERELYVYFHLDPKLLSRAVRDVEAQARIL
ncbi:hypothetical protein DNTS_013610 [Danionella cerebrum]|uniref:HAUS augmin-like complex subunit 3 N-terminal domain-containing protein n=1 Tax=Danionella cerebrum TaxID=2873325 RepID=A0A553QCL4_9TELE|nr:hypothetical protein DNTS_013610 [Danionella translucida]